MGTQTRLLAKLGEILGVKPRTNETIDAPSVAAELPTDPAALFAEIAPSEVNTVPDLVDEPASKEAPTVPYPVVGKRFVTAKELAEIIRANLRDVPDFPTSGISINVYGYTPWNAMLVFAPSSVVPEVAARLRVDLVEIVNRLRHEFDLEIPIE